MGTLRFALALHLLPFVVVPAFGDVALPQVFGDRMVLQSGIDLPVWGKAEPREHVTVTLDGQPCSTTADSLGDWRVIFPPLSPRAEPLTIKIAGSNTIIFRDVLVGEVWICAGQSNMEFPLQRARNSLSEANNWNYPAIRLLKLSGAADGGAGIYDEDQIEQLAPDRFCRGQWDACTADSSKDFSAVGMFFARRLQRELKVPVGIICTAMGGTPTESWIRRGALESDPQLRSLTHGNWLENRRLGEWCRQRAKQNLSRALRQGDAIPGDSAGPNHCFKPTFMWQSAVRPMVPTAIRGVLWYQGESNAESPARVEQHRLLFPLLVNDWRQQWKQGDFPFLYVQLPGMGRPDWPSFRESQRRLLESTTNVGMAVTIDLGHASDVHPTDKRPVGERLARWALSTTYEQNNASVYSGPLFDRLETEQRSLLLRFKHVGDGLVSSDGQPLRHFEMAGADGLFRKADAEIVDDAVRLRCNLIPEPRFARYAWTPFPDPPVNFFNCAGLPASPFTTERSK